MEAYQFYATPKNGIIQIPDEYSNKITNTVKIIVLEEKPWKSDHELTATQVKSDMLLPPTMSTKGWKFNRDKANERR